MNRVASGHEARRIFWVGLQRTNNMRRYTASSPISKRYTYTLVATARPCSSRASQVRRCSPACFLKGKSAVRIHRELMQARRVKGMHFWSRGYCVSTVGLDERTVRAYIRHQEEQEKRQLDLGME